jgi:hypothetical protein
MNQVKLAATLAAAVLIAVVGYNVLPRQPSFGSPTPSPSPTAVPTLPPVLTDGPVAAGRYLNIQNGARFVLDIPAGWTSVVGGWLQSPAGLASPGGLGIAFLRPSALFSDPCHWDIAGTGVWPQPGDVAVGPTAADLATALRQQGAYTASAPTDVVLDGASAKFTKLTLPPALDPTTCDAITGQTDGVYWPFGPSPDGGNLYAQGVGQTWDVWIVDLGAVGRLVIVVDSYPGTSTATRNAATQIVESISFIDT